MSAEPNRTRHYSDEEVRALLKRAAELETEGRALPAPTEGPTLSDVESIAAEAGINPLAIREAARELETGSAQGTVGESLSSGFLGAPISIELESVVPKEVADSVLESLIPLIQRASDSVGQPSLLGRTLSWQTISTQSAKSLQLTVSTGNGETRLFLEERYGNMAGGLFGGIMGGVGGGVGIGVGVGVGLGALGSAFFATVFPAAIVGGSYLLSRAIYASFVKRREKVLQRLMGDMEARVDAADPLQELGGGPTS